MADRLTPEVLREHAKAPDSPMWQGQARQLLNWAADLLEAAQAVVDEQSTDRDPAMHSADCADGKEA